MPIEIKQTDDRTYEVNGKPVFKDTNDNWIEQIELTSNERSTFKYHMTTMANPTVSKVY